MRISRQAAKREAYAAVLGMGGVAVVLVFLWKIAGGSVDWRVVADVGAYGLGCEDPLPACVWAGGRNAGIRAQSGENVYKWCGRRGVLANLPRKRVKMGI